jgi:hypothetical protein
MQKIKTQRRAKKRERAGKARLGEAVRYKPPLPLKRPEGELAMLLDQMKKAELQAQIQAETGTKLRHKIVQHLKARRLAGNISIEVLSAAIGRHRVSMVRIERGSSVATDGTLVKMLAFYGINWQPTARIFTSEAKIEKRRAE